VIIAAVGFTVFLGAGLRWWKVVLLVGCVGLAAPLAYAQLHDYQRARILIPEPIDQNLSRLA